MTIRAKSAVRCARIEGAAVVVLPDDAIAVLRLADLRGDGQISGPHAVLARREERDYAQGGWDHAFYVLGYDVPMAGTDRHARWREAMRLDAEARRQLGAVLGLELRPRQPHDRELGAALGRANVGKDILHDRAQAEAVAVGISVDGPSVGL